MFYNADYKTMQFCDGTVWWAMKSGVPGPLSVITDVKDDISPGDGDVLTYDSAAGEWVSGTAGIGPETDPEVGTVTNNQWCRGDGSAVQCDQAAPAGDNLGNHTATQSLNMGGKDITNAGRAIFYTDLNDNDFVVGDRDKGSVSYVIWYDYSNGVVYLGNKNGSGSNEEVQVRGGLYVTGATKFTGLGGYPPSGNYLCHGADGHMTPNTTCAISDRRLKKDIKPLRPGLQEIMRLTPVSYIWKDEQRGDGTNFGLIAQEVLEIMPEVVTRGSEKDGDWYGLDYDALIAPMINAIQELKAENDDLRASIDTLGARIEALEANRKE